MVIFLFAVVGILIIEFIRKRQNAETDRKEAHDAFFAVLNSIDATISDMKTGEILFMSQHMIDSFGGDLTGQRCQKAFRENQRICSQCPSCDQLLTVELKKKHLSIDGIIQKIVDRAIRIAVENSKRHQRIQKYPGLTSCFKN